VRGADGRLAGILEVLRDQTGSLALERFLIGESERQEAEIREVRESQAEVLHRDRLMALGRLVASVAHEIHTPLGAILSSVDVMRRSLGRVEEGSAGPDGRAVKALRSAAAIVDEGARRIEHVVRTLRLYSRLDEGEVQETDLHQGLDSTLELLRYRTGERIEVVRDYGELPAVRCRPDALNQVFMNLLLNAVQAIAERGEIRIRTRAEEGGVVVEISDSGCGMAQSDLSRIFEAGFTTRSRGSGTGLGLAICKRIVDDHGGTIGVESRPDHGTKFTVRLPVGRTPA
jgi:two-component system NtrC family sensor kinase